MSCTFIAKMISTENDTEYFWNMSLGLYLRLRLQVKLRVTDLIEVGRFVCFIVVVPATSTKLHSLYMYSHFHHMESGAGDLQGETFVYTPKNTKVYVPQRQ